VLPVRVVKFLKILNKLSTTVYGSSKYNFIIVKVLFNATL